MQQTDCPGFNIVGEEGGVILPKLYVLTGGEKIVH